MALSRITILTSCTSKKRYSPANQLTQADFRLLHDPVAFARAEERLADFRLPAVEMYTGQQHVRLMKGVRFFQEQNPDVGVEIWILSAGYGLIPGSRHIVPYECTFQGMVGGDLNRWAGYLRIQQTAAHLFARANDVTLVMLGKDYLRSLGMDSTTHFVSPILFLTSQSGEKYIKGAGQKRIVLISIRDSARLSCGMVALKGEIARRVMHFLVANNDTGLSLLFDTSLDMTNLLANVTTK